MKKEHYYFDMPEETYKYIIKKGILKESKKEKTILDLCLKGRYYLNPPCYQGCGSCCNGLY